MADQEELFDILDPQTLTVVGQKERRLVHSTGLLHKAVYCWVFNEDGHVLLQRRSPLKKIGANQWDLSLAEHLQPGESYRQAVVRGLKEELGLSVPEERIQGPLSDIHRRELHGVDSQGNEFHDVEMVQSFRVFVDGSVHVSFDDGEVVEVQWLDPGTIQGKISADPTSYTAWLAAEGTYLGWSMKTME